MRDYNYGKYEQQLKRLDRNITMTDYKNNKPTEPLTRNDIILSTFFVSVVFGGWLILNLL